MDVAVIREHFPFPCSRPFRQNLAASHHMSPLCLRTLKAGITYFSSAFGAGFVMGAIRVPFLVPRLGERLAELIEMPIMFVVIFLTACFITQRFALPATALVRLNTGIIALALLLAAELLLAVAPQDRSLGEYVSSRDPISGSVYLAMLALFTAMPFVALIAFQSADIRLIL
ncbi:MAG: hypothetical protein WAT36_00300 [Chromatiaceae bacterium]